MKNLPAHGILYKIPQKFPAKEVGPTEKKGIKIAAQNRKAYHDYFVEDKYEAGIELFGTEVKSIRAGTLNLKDSYCTVKDGELFVHSMHISPTLVPLSVYFKDARVKVEIGLCKGKKNYDKREASAKRDAAREIDRTMKERNR